MVQESRTGCYVTDSINQTPVSVKVFEGTKEYIDALIMARKRSTGFKPTTAEIIDEWRILATTKVEGAVQLRIPERHVDECLAYLRFMYDKSATGETMDPELLEASREHIRRLIRVPKAEQENA